MTNGSLISLAAIVLIGGSLSAVPALAGSGELVLADPIVDAPAPVPVANWSGAYGGFTLGAAFGSGDAELDDYFGPIITRDVEVLGLFPSEVEQDGTSATGGLTLGYNHQLGSYLAGVELDVSAMNHETDGEFSRFDPTPNIMSDTNTSYRTEISGLATLRVRGGIVHDRNLFYATAGLAAGQVENEFTLAVPDFAFYEIDEAWSEEGTRHGYVFGAGLERQLSERWSFKGEVMYYDLEDVTVTGTGDHLPGFEGNGLGYEFDNAGYVARVGVNFRF